MLRVSPGLVFILAPSILAGCVSEGPASDLSPTFFHLEYVRESTYDGVALPAERFTLTLTGPDEVHDADGVIRPAFRLEQRTVSGDFAWYLDFYLDASLRVIRMDDLCARLRFEDDGQTHDCRSMDIQWFWRGHQAHGIGLPLMLDQPPRTTSLRTGEVFEITETHGRNAKGHTWIQVDPPEFSLVNASIWFRGTYWYESGQWVPYRVVHGSADTGSVTTLVRAEFGDRLPQLADHHLTRPEAEQVPTAYRVYPGDDADLFGHGWTVHDAYATLIDDSPQAAGVLADGGCVYETYHLMTTSERVPVLVSDVTVTTIFHLIGADDRREKWHVQWYRFGQLEPMINVWQDPSQDTPAPTSCAAIWQSPPMTHTMQDTWRAARPIFGDCLPHLSAWFRAFSNFYEGDEPSTGWGQIGVIKTEAPCDAGPGSGLGRVLTMDAHTGWWTNVQPSYDEYRRWEPGGRDPEAASRQGEGTVQPFVSSRIHLAKGGWTPSTPYTSMQGTS